LPDSAICRDLSDLLCEVAILKIDFAAVAFSAILRGNRRDCFAILRKLGAAIKTAAL